MAFNMLGKRNWFLLIFIFLIILFAFALLPFFYLKRNYPDKESWTLFQSAERLKSLLKKKNVKGIYNLFNPTFQREISEERFTTTLAEWLKGKKMRKVETKFTNITGFTGQVSTWVWEDKKNYLYLFTSWIKTDSGWRLLWLTPILSQDFEYGRGEVSERRRLLGLAIKEAFSKEGFGDLFLKLNLPRQLVFIKKGRPEEKPLLDKSPLPILWLTLDEIKKKSQYLPIPFYFDFGAIRIIDNLATVYLDIIPIKNGENQSLRQPRGLQFQFRRKEGDWEFAGYGSRW
ncbi:MAG: hypothetical protein ABIK97_02640 [candidate division WOR-3 bacterium]